ncbi:MAG TPA: SurA N-terminal domain-containing protein [Candidatus Limnocylindria bacterium]|jgi:hypothetical protein|nr:SurA N-terminal domain-containing protein [Candidatus Limnocylindria bacterium]
MFGTIRKHQSWLWGIIVTLTIVSFVVFYGTGSQRSDFSTQQSFGTLYGRRISREDMLNARRAAEISEKLQGRNRRTGDIQQDTMRYLLIDSKVKQLGIVVGDDAVAKAIKEMLKDRRTGAFDYDAVMKNVTLQTGITEADFVEHMRGELARMHLVEVVTASSKFVTPREAENEFRRENEEVSTSAVFFTKDEFTSAAPISPDLITKFYSNRIANYRIPDRTVLDYVTFGIGKHLEAARAEFIKQGTAITNRFEEIYAQNGPDAFRDKEDKPLSKEAALARFKEDTMEKLALSGAHKEAIEFYNSLNEKRTNALTAELFERLAAAKGLSVQTTTPFASTDQVPGLEEVTQLTAKAARLTPQIAYTEPLIGSTMVVIPFLKQRLPSEIPPFSAVKDRATADYRENEAIQAASVAARAFLAAATNTVDGKKKAFADVAKEHNRPVQTLPPVSAAAQSLPGLDPRMEIYSLKSRVLALPVGETASITIRDGVAIVNVTGRKQPDDAMVKATLNTFIAELRQSRQNQAFSDWLTAEQNRSGVASLLKNQDGGN